MIPYLKSLIVKLFTDLLNPLNKFFFGRHKVIQYGSYLKKESEQNYLRGKLHGNQKIWHSVTRLKSCALYTHGVCLEEKSWYYSGQLRRHSKYKQGICVETKDWNESGQLKSRSIYENGEEVSQEVWYENGSPYLFWKDKDGGLWDHIIYYKNGQMRFEMRQGLILNTWLEDGTQGVKDGNGIRIDYDFGPRHIDVQETVKDGKLNGYAVYWYHHMKQMKAEGYYKNNKKVGIWKEYKGAKLIDLDYDQEGTLSPEEEESLAFKKFIEEQKKQENTNQK